MVTFSVILRSLYVVSYICDIYLPAFTLINNYRLPMLCQFEAQDTEV